MSTYAKRILSVAVVVLMQTMSAMAADQPIAHWVFDAAHVSKGVVRPAAGGLEGRINGHTRLIRSRTPNALIFDGRTDLSFRCFRSGPTIAFRRDLRDGQQYLMRVADVAQPGTRRQG